MESLGGFMIKQANGLDWTVGSLMKGLGITKEDRETVGSWVDFPPDQKIRLTITSSKPKEKGISVTTAIGLVFDINDREIYYMPVSNLENGIIRETVNGMKRVKLPIPEEYGGGWATGSSTTDAINNLINRIKDHLNDGPKFKCVQFSECANAWLGLKVGSTNSTWSSYCKFGFGSLC